MKPVRLIVTGIAMCATAVSHGAGLEVTWETKRKDVTIPFARHTVDATFSFTNTGTEPVVIDKVQVSCGCTTAFWESKAYEPGETAQIVTKTDTKNPRSAVIDISVVLVGRETPETLALALTPEQAFSVDARVIQWRKGDNLESKVVSFTAVGDHKIRVTALQSSSPLFKSDIEEVVAGRSYRLRINATQTRFPVRATLDASILVDDALEPVKHTLYGFLN